MGVANKKSVAFFIAKTLIKNGAKCILSVQNKEIKKNIEKHFIEEKIIVCDVQNSQNMNSLAKQIPGTLDGLVHSIAFADFTQGRRPFEETSWEQFQQAQKISAFSLVELTKNLKEKLTPGASIITLSISDTDATCYGYLGPIKAMLDNMVKYLAKSLAPHCRVNAIGAGPLKTSASAGIPGYMENYLFAEKMTLRKKALATQEVANCACFLLSEASSGINATTLKVDLGMHCNAFDEDFVRSSI